MTDSNNNPSFIKSEIDTEIINGAILEMEYSFNISSTERIAKIYIEDEMPDRSKLRCK